MTILELIQSDGFYSKKKASTRGGEYAGPCPWCGGDNRFLCWPEQGEFGEYWCRKCGRGGDAIQYLRDHRHMTFPEACQFLGREVTRPSTLAGSRPAKPQWEPRVTTAPTDLWQERARRLVEESENWLFHPHTFAPTDVGMVKRTSGPFRGNHQGTSPWFGPYHNRFEGHEQWGLEPVLKDDGTPKKIWIPRGLTIPLCQDGKIYRIRIRRPKFALRSEADPRYYLLRGSDTRAMILGTDKPVSIIVESELDALLLHQEAGDLVNVISLGNAQSRPDKKAADLLTAKPVDPPGPRWSFHRRFLRKSTGKFA